jgi:Asp-tRNA(Asn)/Glu-tRNA(Gln) amidotransferase A subunit family amidase
VEKLDAFGWMGLTRGLSNGCQTIAAPGRDTTSIVCANAVEREIGGFTPPPGDD